MASGRRASHGCGSGRSSSDTDTFDLGYAVSTRVLGASANTLGAAGMAAVARCLAGNPGLIRLDLRGSGSTAPELNLLADALAHNTPCNSCCWTAVRLPGAA